MRRWRVRMLVVAADVTLACAGAGRATAPSGAETKLSPTAVPETAQRQVVVISDLHMGVGKKPDGSWEPVEDFRWPNALSSFLAEISCLSGGRTTLVIAGDMLELWQHPDIPCSSGDPDHGCTVAEVASLVDRVIAGHAREFADLAAFARWGDNRLIVLPGNHDAGLLVEPVRSRVLAALEASSGRVELSASGVWATPDGQVVVEHGQQMPGERVNGYPDWPKVTGALNGREFLLRPWGELFVHRLYDSVEAQCPLIDNIIPQSVGVGYYKDWRGTLGTAADAARFVAFNLVRASPTQRGDLGPGGEGAAEWDVVGARAMGWKLFRSAGVEDRLAPGLAAGRDAALRDALDALAADREGLPDTEVRALCDAAFTAGASEPCPTTRGALAATIAHGIVPGAKKRGMEGHLKERLKAFPDMKALVYGHTHQLEEAEVFVPPGSIEIEVANSGAFQRLVDRSTYSGLARRFNADEATGLARVPLDALPACYPAVFVEYERGLPRLKLQNWLAGEDGAGGEFVAACNNRCAAVGSCAKSR